MEKKTSRRVVILLVPGVLSLDAYGPYEAFCYATVLRAQRILGLPEDLGAPVPEELRAYDVVLAGLQAGPVPAMSGTQLLATHAIGELQGPIDTLIVAGGDLRMAQKELLESDQVVSQVRRLSEGARRIGATCTGTFVLALAGMLEGRRATSHWNACDVLQAMFPKVHVDPHPIHIRDDRFYTSAGGTTGIDLALAMISEDHGAALAHAVARQLVLYVQRPAAQAQLSVPLICQRAETSSLRDLQDWLLDNLTSDLTIPALASRTGMSERNFARAFKREVGMTPARYVESLRLEAALRKLRLGHEGIEQVAADVGFPCAETFRRAFVRRYGESPATIRAASVSEA
ncbi:MAG: helix-turn-helix domain-containing protein [Myxococcales bacterium]|nr:helix-turn-helix domain-containing protein [Myxococcales bacterium]